MITFEVASNRLIQAMRESLGSMFGLDLSKISHKETIGKNYEFFVGNRTMLCALRDDGKKIEVWQQDPKPSEKEDPDDDSVYLGLVTLKLTKGTAEVVLG